MRRLCWINETLCLASCYIRKPSYVNIPDYDILVIWDRDDLAEPLLKWHVYVTGHSLGGALATLLALELSSSQLAK